MTLTESSTATAEASTTTATAATSAATAVSDVGSVRTTVEPLQFWRNGLVGLSHDFTEITTKLGVAVGEEGHGGTGGSSTAGSADTVDVVLDVAWHVVVDNVGDALDVWMLVMALSSGRMVYEEERSSMSIDYVESMYT